MERPLSTLELTALGVVWKKGPCTAYAVMQNFAGSKGETYRSGAGSIYPLLKRLCGAGFLAETGKGLRITDEGIVRLRAWIGNVDAARDVAANLDPLRSRVHFLGLLAHEEQQDFVSKCLSELRRLRREVLADQAGFVDHEQQYGALALRGAVLETEARIKWMMELKKALDRAVTSRENTGRQA